MVILLNLESLYESLYDALNQVCFSVYTSTGKGGGRSRFKTYKFICSHNPVVFIAPSCLCYSPFGGAVILAADS
jgi:hypothetical protein